MLQRHVDRAGLAQPLQLQRHRAHGVARGAGVGMEDGEDIGHFHPGLFLAPAVVVGGHGDRGVGDLGLAGQLRFGHRGHADQVAAPLPVHVGLGFGRESRTLHHDIGAPLVDLHFV